MNEDICMDLSQRDIRQRELVPPGKLAGCYALVIGVGAIGRQVAIQLAAVGVMNLHLIDFDTVGVENLAPQAYFPQDIGKLKVAATAELCRQINPSLFLLTLAERFRRSSGRTLKGLNDPALRPVVFCCVDSISTRKLVWETVRGKAALFIDGRMSAEVMRVLASDRPAVDGHYATTLFAESEAQGGACTAKSTVYTASIAAGLMVSQFARWLRGVAVDRDVMLNLLAGEMVTQ